MRGLRVRRGRPEIARLLALTLGVAVAGCASRDTSRATSGLDGLGEIAVDASGAGAGEEDVNVVSPRLPPPGTEARRGVVEKPEDDRLLAPHRDVIRAHFGDAGPLALQVAPVSGGRAALLLTRAKGEAKPLVLLVDAAGNVLWAKERPLAGTRPLVTEIAIAGGPNGEVVIAWFDTPTHVLAARKWEAGGGLLADFSLLEMETCDALSSLYWPGQGWLVVASTLGAGRAQLLAERGARAWGREGKVVMTGWRAAAPASLVLDTETSVLLVYPGYAPATTTDRYLASRWSSAGEPAWRVPLELGEMPRGAAPPRATAERVEAGRVRVTLAKGTPSATERYAVNVTATGAVQPE